MRKSSPVGWVKAHHLIQVGAGHSRPALFSSGANNPKGTIMQSTKTFLLLTSCALCIALTQSALADYFGLEVVERTDLQICQDPSEPEIPYKLDVCEIHVVFDDPGDRLISTALCDVSTTAPQGFFQHTLGGDTAPACNLIPVFPTLVCDSFVTLGLECDAGGSATDPDFDSTGFNTSGEVSGGWFNSNPANGQGAPDANGRVMIARFSYRQNKNTSGNVCVFAKLAGSDDISTYLMQPFDCSVPGGGLPAGGEPPSACVDGTGSCFQNNGTPGCDCGPCCELVCEIDPFCCDDTWDQTCADSPGRACDVCDVFGCQDCNDNDRKDWEDIACGGGETCDGGIPGSYDCNNNGVPDECEIDQDQGEPGEFFCPGQCNPVCETCTGLCDPDCNFNGIPDECDIAAGNSPDQAGNGIPDECEDCNGNGIIDMCETIDCGAPSPPPCDAEDCETSPDCDGNGIPDECDVAMRGPLFVSGADADNLGHCDRVDLCGNLYSKVMTWALAESRIEPADDEFPILAIGLNGLQAGEALGRWLHPIGAPGVHAVTELTGPDSIAEVNFADYAVIYVPSIDWGGGLWTEGGITEPQLAALNARKADIEVFLDFLGGGVVALTEGHPEQPGGSHNPYGWLHVPIGFGDLLLSAACPTPALAEIPGHTADCVNQSGFHYHNRFGDQIPSSTGVVVLGESVPEKDPLLVGRVDFTAERDCNANGTPDACDVDACFPESPEFPGCADCNQNGIPDECDIADGTSEDSDEDGVPDECDCGTCPWDSPVEGPNGDVGPEDLAYVLGNWGPIPTDADIEIVCIDNLDPMPGNGDIGPEDLAKILGNWGPCPPP